MSEFYDELDNKSKDNTDRYKNCKVLVDKDTGDTILSTREVIDIPVHPNDLYHTIQSHELFRLDILAQKYYKNPLLWWVIAQANNIYDPLKEIEVNTVLRIPCLETLYGNNGILL